MIESVFITIFMCAIVLNLFGWIKGNIIFTFIALMTWLTMIITNSINIEVPGVSTPYMEQGLQAFCWMFVFIDIIFLIVHFISTPKIRDWLKGDWGG